MNRWTAVAMVFVLWGLAAEARAVDAVIEEGKNVKFEYTLKVKGEVVDSSEGRGPLEYIHGSGQIIPGLESQLKGLKVGDERTIVIPPEQAYGPIDPNAFQEVPKTFFPPDVTIQPGLVVPMQSKEGKMFQAVVAELKENTVLLNFNHPLAGEELTFQVKIVAIQ